MQDNPQEQCKKEMGRSYPLIKVENYCLTAHYSKANSSEFNETCYLLDQFRIVVLVCEAINQTVDK